ncbi:uncharacterized protein BDZ83DRAFT_598083 [Colletotrichum acutatum]|uniref:Uncharacterized protein n=1 Tax=Glomerella acutata TaxID=27357 RepID=A0AAD8XQD9_GLOAC|nr:uncharacterized protein BDZ83DRAFT_598083 [Colletotrichum acutatum]KAK1731614.1 hypothetical protein BDZ83DRAFT_598083 [Colletotrichum acutatum]
MTKERQLSTVCFLISLLQAVKVEGEKIEARRTEARRIEARRIEALGAAKLSIPSCTLLLLIPSILLSNSLGIDPDVITPVS